MKQRLLITGAGGFLGHHICRYAVNSKNWDTYGIFKSNPFSMDNVTALHIDLSRKSDIEDIFKKIKPQAVIHAAAISQPNICEKDPLLSQSVNVDASIHIARLCVLYNSSCVFTSSDQVFDGEHAPYSETSKPCPINIYGAHKLLAEKEMQKAFPGQTICRMPLMYGEPSQSSFSFITPFINDLKNSKIIKLFTDEIRTPVYAEDAVKGIFMALKNPGEVFHLGGKERISRFDFGCMLAEALNADKNLIVPVLRKEVQMPAARPRDLSMTSEKAFIAGYNPGLASDRLRKMTGTAE